LHRPLVRTMELWCYHFFTEALPVKVINSRPEQ
jgi:hypothetical protein